jgi:hypothetical protein
LEYHPDRGLHLQVPSGIPAIDIRNLGSSEGYNVVFRFTPEKGIEIVEITSCGSNDDYVSSHKICF